MFSYSSRAKRKTVVEKFGFNYDRQMEMYDDYNATLDQYPNIDFYYNLNVDYEKDEEFAYCIIKNADNKKTLFLKPPVIGDLINVFKRTIQ